MTTPQPAGTPPAHPAPTATTRGAHLPSAGGPTRKPTKKPTKHAKPAPKRGGGKR